MNGGGYESHLPEVEEEEDDEESYTVHNINCIK
jgi:hypothetical protein